MKILLRKSDYLKGVWFHLAGIAAIIWFIVRVLPKPDRIRYPCQQMSVSIAVGYIAFWSLLWSAIFHGLGLWIKKAKLKTEAIAPTLIVVLIIIFSISGPIFSNNNSYIVGATVPWDPPPNEPIGTPQGANPGRVVWVWNQNATSWDGTSNYWWYEQNNNQSIIKEMFSAGLQKLANETNDYDAWDTLFQHFNNGEGYQSGEKIVIKVNLNNCWQNSYEEKDNDADANPYLVKALLDQLVNVVSVSQEDITVYDAVRTMANWFYNPLASEFPDVNYVDYLGGASGRQKVTSSGIKIYFTNGMDRTLPSCVTQAKYFINMPIMKRHNIGSGVTLAGKNHFGSFMTSPSGLHSYHQSAFTEGNPAPQTDIHAHEHIGGKTLLYIGDGLYGSPVNHFTFGHFNMYPFNDDWANSLFFSQDGVAIDSVMWDFLNVEGNPAEGSQNYLHQSAEPPADVYDPEGDGIYLNDSLGVHEHWNTTIDIFSSDRYSGPAGDGIDYIAISEVELEADANGPYNGTICEPIEFSGSASGGVSPYTWYWEFGDGGTSTQQNADYQYNEPGMYTVMLTVTDDLGYSDDDITYADIEHPELIVNANGPYVGSIYEPIQFYGKVTGGCEPYDWFWEFGDGASSSQQNPEHQYTDTGNYTVMLTVTDDADYSDNDVTWAIVSKNHKPGIPKISGPTSGKAGKEYNYTFNAVDLDGDDVKYYIDWGDNTSEWTDFNASGTDVKVNHTWSKEGIYNITVIARDIYGFEGLEGTLTVTIPKNKPSNFNFNLIDWLFEQFPNLFLILRYILRFH